jgi:hypothetical protein
MPIMKVSINTYWLVRVPDNLDGIDAEQAAIDQVADVELIAFASDYDNFDAEVVPEETLGEEDKSIIVPADGSTLVPYTKQDEELDTGSRI